MPPCTIASVGDALAELTTGLRHGLSNCKTDQPSIVFFAWQGGASAITSGFISNAGAGGAAGSAWEQRWRNSPRTHRLEADHRVIGRLNDPVGRASSCTPYSAATTTPSAAITFRRIDPMERRQRRQH